MIVRVNLDKGKLFDAPDFSETVDYEAIVFYGQSQKKIKSIQILPKLNCNNPFWDQARFPSS